MTAVFYIVMLLWIAFILYNIFNAGNTNEFTNFWEKIKSNAAKQLLP
jgi:hypothetical protein